MSQSDMELRERMLALVVSTDQVGRSSKQTLAMAKEFEAYVRGTDTAKP